MPVIDQGSQPEIYEKIKDRNLQSQWFLLETIFAYSSEAIKFTFTPDIIYAMHAAAANFLTANPGRLRDGNVHIHGSEHVPPNWVELEHLLSEYCRYINADVTERKTAVHFAAYAMWKFTWIHPFNECNGRTARVLGYLVYSFKKGRWLQGTKLFHEIIRENDDAYYLGLRMADESIKGGHDVDLSYLEQYLMRVFHLQFLSSYFVAADG